MSYSFQRSGYAQVENNFKYFREANMFDDRALDDIPAHSLMFSDADAPINGAGFSAWKRVFDVIGSVLLLPALVLLASAIFFLNPMYNRGSLFFVQARMGRDCQPFRAIKFRTMRKAGSETRGANCPLEKHRITKLGSFLRKSRIDELPQIINVLRGEMSLIGPRPDYFDHAVEYVDKVPGYRERHAVRPGISGLAQTELGYIEGVEGTRRKVKADLYYITHMSLALEMWIFWRTIYVVVRRGGA